MKIIATLIFSTAASMALMALAVDAYEWELTGSCQDALLIHHLRDCRP